MIELVVVEGAVLALLALLVVGLLRSHAEILRRLHELGAGLEPSQELPSVLPQRERPGPGVAAMAAADIAGQTPSGDAIAIGVAGAPHNTLLGFLSSGCLTCGDFWRAFRDVDQLNLIGTRLVVVTKSADAESVSAIANLAAADLAVVMSTDAWLGYRVPGSPYFILVDGPTGRVAGEGTAATWSQVQSLMLQAAGDLSGQKPHYENDGDRRERVDAELLASGIGPGHPSLYPERQPLNGQLEEP